jgi:hypothetical protein
VTPGSQDNFRSHADSSINSLNYSAEKQENKPKKDANGDIFKEKWGRVQRNLTAGADVPAIEVIMVAEADTRVNTLGIKGIGEIGIVGLNAAVANTVFNATGQRTRSLPIRSEKIL